MVAANEFVGKDRRKAERLDMPFLVKYKPFWEKKEIERYTTNLSGTGFKISTSEDIEKGRKMHIKVYLPGDATPVDAIGIVMWKSSKEMSDGVFSVHNLGIRFDWINPKDRERFAFCIGKILIDHHNQV